MDTLASSLPALIVAVIFFAILISAGVAGIKAAPWVPTRNKDIERMLRLANLRPGELVLDLGAGDGRFLISAVKQFSARGLGYECSIGPWLIAQLRLRIAGVSGRAGVQFKDFYAQSLSRADVITCFLTPSAMRKLEPKFRKEAKPGSRLVSYAFAFPTIMPDRADKPNSRLATVFLYQQKPIIPIVDS